MQSQKRLILVGNPNLALISQMNKMMDLICSKQIPVFLKWQDQVKENNRQVN